MRNPRENMAYFYFTIFLEFPNGSGGRTAAQLAPETRQKKADKTAAYLTKTGFFNF
jgi:hypothetical protein